MDGSSITSTGPSQLRPLDPPPEGLLEPTLGVECIGGLEVVRLLKEPLLPEEPLAPGKPTLLATLVFTMAVARFPTIAGPTGVLRQCLCIGHGYGLAQIGT
jgi:hypothetical protein